MIKKNIKFGIRVPQTVIEPLRLNKNNGNHLWIDGIVNKINSVMIAFKLLDEGYKPPPTYQEIRYNMIFDIKMEDFQRKARYVAGGHAAVAPSTLLCVSFVSREIVRISLALAALNDTEVKTSDIHNAYFTAPCLKKIWTTLGS